MYIQVPNQCGTVEVMWRFATNPHYITEGSYLRVRRTSNQEIKNINWHFYLKCNYKCKFCFGKFKEIKKELDLSEKLEIIEKLNQIGVEKITYTGGEPLLSPDLPKLLLQTKKYGKMNMVVTNGFFLNDEFIQANHSNIDWIGLSLDSASEKVQQLLGRGFGNHVKKSIENTELIKKFRIKLKINTVVSQLNYLENISNLIKLLNPNRWKVFQVLKVEGENDNHINSLLITEKQFMIFVNRHKHLNPIYENNNIFRSSYVMLDPLGRFFQNTKGHTEYSSSILEVNPLEALAEVGWDREKFLKRGGIYNW